MINTYIYTYAGFSIKVYISVSGSRCNKYAPTCASMCPCARACVCIWVHPHPRRNMRAPSVGVDRGWLGSQAFNYASAFNANIDAWNTASVTTLSYVCVAFGRSGAQPRAGRA